MLKVNSAKLKYFCEIKGITFKELSDFIGINITTFYNKVNNYKDREFYRNEIVLICEKLNLSKEQMLEIFFDEKLA